MSKYNIGDIYATLGEIQHTSKVKHFIHGFFVEFRCGSL